MWGVCARPSAVRGLGCSPPGEAGGVEACQAACGIGHLSGHQCCAPTKLNAELVPCRSCRSLQALEHVKSTNSYMDGQAPQQMVVIDDKRAGDV